MRSFHKIYGLTIGSTINLDELPRIDHAGDAAIDIRTGRDAPPEKPEDNQHLARIPDIGGFHIRNGAEITVYPAPGVAEADVRQYLYGVALTAAFYQRGDSLIHASAIDVGGRAHLFCGHSGEGKSTLLMGLSRAGAIPLCDDVGVLRRREDGAVWFYPGVPRVKLWKDALARFGIDSTPLHRDLARYDKFHLPMSPPARDGLPLGSVFQLASSAAATATEIIPCNSKRTLEILLRNTYRQRLMSRLGDMPRHMACCLAAAIQGHGFDLHRPRSLDSLSDTSARVLAHLATLFPE